MKRDESFPEAVLRRTDEAREESQRLYDMAQELAAKADAAVGPAIARMEAAEADVARLKAGAERLGAELGLLARSWRVNGHTRCADDLLRTLNSQRGSKETQ